jgi:DNA-binding transcriptional MerR regulator
VDGLVSTEDAARALGISARTLTRYASDGRITPAVVLSGGKRNHYRWDLDDLRRQLRELAREQREQ